MSNAITLPRENLTRKYRTAATAIVSAVRRRSAAGSSGFRDPTSCSAVAIRQVISLDAQALASGHFDKRLAVGIGIRVTQLARGRVRQRHHFVGEMRRLLRFAP